jgi:hypothetical protein
MFKKICRNSDRMARDIGLDITLKDRNGNVIAVIKDKLRNIDPATVYHYGVTRKIRGAATAGISVKASAASYLKLSTPIMKHARLSELRLSRQEDTMKLSGALNSEYDCPLRALTLHYQFLSKDNKILGGGNEWMLEELKSKGGLVFSSEIPVSVQHVAKVVYSVDFDALELIK